MPTPADDPHNGHVLAVDDCPTMRELVRASLERLGYRVQVVDSGWAALQAVAHDAFDAFVLDVEIPGLDGPAVGCALRNDPRTASAMIAMHTSVDEASVRARFSHYDAFVPKSGDPVALGEHVDRLLRDRRCR
jgi:CheY-like chemotaxis protein